MSKKDAKATIGLPDELKQQAIQRAHAMNRSLSNYVFLLIKEDIEKGAATEESTDSNDPQIAA